MTNALTTESAKPVTTLVLGAGFSFAAGLPLTRDLFETDELPWRSDWRRSEHQEVLSAYRRWKEQNRDGNAEQWLRFVYDNQGFELQTGASWAAVLTFALARLVKLPRGSKAPFFHGITTSVASSDHREFWTVARQRCDLRYVVTTNYDILAEQGLKERYSEHRTAPLCHYGGFPARQIVKTWRNPALGDYDETALGQEISIYKLHGSLNWAHEPHDFKIHDDVRAVFRRSVRVADGKADTFSSKFDDRLPAVVPPLPEKRRPDWLANVWSQAERALSQSAVWIVCGYSLPPYDEAVRALFARAARNARSLRRVVVMSPDSTKLIDRWRDICASHVGVFALPGLPDVSRIAWW